MPSLESLRASNERADRLLRDAQAHVSAEAARTAALIAESITKQFAAQHAAWARAQEAMQRALKPSIDLGTIVANWDKTFAQLEPRAFELGTLGWTIPMWADLRMLRTVFVDASPREVDDAFENYYVTKRGENARTLFAEIAQAKALSRWQPLLEQSVAAFKQRRYLIVVPTLLLVLEGVIAIRAEFARSRTNVPKGVRSRRARARTAFDRMLWASIEGFLLELYRDSDFSQDPPTRLNRHWILHGRQEPSWSRTDCLRLYQAIHTLGS